MKVEIESVVDDIHVIYGETTPRKFIELGYKLENLEQIIEEPTITGCSLCKNDKQVCYLYFYNIKEFIDINMLYDIPIDFVFLDTIPFKKVIKFSLSQKVLFNITVHLLSAVIFYFMFKYKFLPISEERTNSGIVILALPTIICALIWAEPLINTKGKVFKKILVGLSMIFNLVITIIILFVINEIILKIN